MNTKLLLTILFGLNMFAAPTTDRRAGDVKAKSAKPGKAERENAKPAKPGKAERENAKPAKPGKAERENAKPGKAGKEEKAAKGGKPGKEEKVVSDKKKMNEVNKLINTIKKKAEAVKNAKDNPEKVKTEMEEKIKELNALISQLNSIDKKTATDSLSAIQPKIQEARNIKVIEKLSSKFTTAIADNEKTVQEISAGLENMDQINAKLKKMLANLNTAENELKALKTKSVKDDGTKKYNAAKNAYDKISDELKKLPDVAKMKTLEQCAAGLAAAKKLKFKTDPAQRNLAKFIEQIQAKIEKLGTEADETTLEKLQNYVDEAEAALEAAREETEGDKIAKNSAKTIKDLQAKANKLIFYTKQQQTEVTRLNKELNDKKKELDNMLNNKKKEADKTVSSTSSKAAGFLDTAKQIGGNLFGKHVNKLSEAGSAVVDAKVAKHADKLSKTIKEKGGVKTDEEEVPTDEEEVTTNEEGVEEGSEEGAPEEEGGEEGSEEGTSEEEGSEEGSEEDEE